MANNFSSYISLVQYKKFLLKKNCELEELFQKMNFDYFSWWLGHFLKASSLKISNFNTVQAD